MKKTRKLIPALVMLLVSAIMLSTASYAWFASNLTVTAQDMSVTATVNTKFLQISADNLSFNTYADAAVDAKTDLNLIHAKIEEGAVAWYQGSSQNTSDANSGSATKIPAEKLNAELASCTLENTFYVKLYKPGTVYNFKVEDVTITDEGGASLAKAVRVLIVGTDGGIELWSNTSGDMVQVGKQGDAIFTSLTETAKNFKVYVFYDGEDATASTDNASVLTAVGVSITFTASETNE